jgi:hypothetical protein
MIDMDRGSGGKVRRGSLSSNADRDNKNKEGSPDPLSRTQFSFTHTHTMHNLLGKKKQPFMPYQLRKPNESPEDACLMVQGNTLAQSYRQFDSTDHRPASLNMHPQEEQEFDGSYLGAAHGGDDEASGGRRAQAQRREARRGVNEDDQDHSVLDSDPKRSRVAKEATVDDRVAPVDRPNLEASNSLKATPLVPRSPGSRRTPALDAMASRVEFLNVMPLTTEVYADGLRGRSLNDVGADLLAGAWIAAGEAAEVQTQSRQSVMLQHSSPHGRQRAGAGSGRSKPVLNTSQGG